MNERGVERRTDKREENNSRDKAWQGYILSYLPALTQARGETQQHGHDHGHDKHGGGHLYTCFSMTPNRRGNAATTTFSITTGRRHATAYYGQITALGGMSVGSCRMLSLHDVVANVKTLE